MKLITYKMKLDPNQRISSANVQAEFYHMCRNADINIRLEYRADHCRFDLVVYNDNYDILAIIEAKNKSTKNAQINKSGRQYKKYNSFGVPVVYLMNFADLEKKFNFVKKLFYENKKVSAKDSPSVKVIPEGLKGDGTMQEEEYGYVIKKTGHKFKKYKNSEMHKRIY